MRESGVRRPTDAELEILSVLWQRGPSTVREVHESLDHARDTRYTTTLKLLQIMSAKGLVRRDEAQRAHVYRAAAAKEKTLARIVHELIDRAFGGSTERLLLNAIRSGAVSADELNRIRKLIDEQESIRDHTEGRLGKLETGRGANAQSPSLPISKSLRQVKGD